ncbi:MAG: hypothetical protein IJH12_07060 [Clostridia bacterium]|nr:hypothetical protein [Clostridia bacterium]
MEEEKINQLVNLLTDLPLYRWNQIKNEIDIAYRDVEYEKVPNSQLETLKNNLMNISNKLVIKG